ncbi:hypothetical protein MA03_03255 [Infirmifilum uzonense]|uniref:Uncharacterized protein n=1 Tax=Infirmifilum uzonense TaxID=1550241 RepID=A0A0F7FI83_9CREN|nr:hypothetical protein [Infirmifilum uzonense]AKG38494.1 hypothetical protein MA03_03255 [Infirmifilum uzonense]
MPFELSEEYLSFLASFPTAESIAQLSRGSGLPPHIARRAYRELSSILQMRFLIDFPKLRILPVALLIDGHCPSWLGATLIASLEGPVRNTLCVGFASLKRALELQDEHLIKGLELNYWDFTSYPSSSPREPREEDYALPTPPKGFYTRPDAVDLAVLSFKLDSPFEKITECYKKALRLDETLRELSSSTLAYHFRKHLKPFWKGNRAYLVQPIVENPVQVYIIEGWRSPVVARTVTTLLGYWFSIVDEKKALIVSQFTTREKVAFYRFLRSMGVRVVFGELIMVPEETKYLRPLLWRNVKHARWASSFESVESEKPVFP